MTDTAGPDASPPQTLTTGALLLRLWRDYLRAALAPMLASILLAAGGGRDHRPAGPDCSSRP